MENNKNKQEKDIELFMIAQFIDVIDVLDEKMEDLKCDIRNRKKVYLEYISNIDKKELEEIKGLIYDLCGFDIHLSYKIGLIDGMKIKNKCI